MTNYKKLNSRSVEQPNERLAYALVEYVDGQKAEDYFDHANSQVQVFQQ